MPNNRTISALAVSFIKKHNTPIVFSGQRIAGSDGKDLRDLARAVGVNGSGLRDQDKKSILFLIDTIIRLSTEEPQKGSLEDKYKGFARSETLQSTGIQTVEELGTLVKEFLSRFTEIANSQTMSNYVKQNSNNELLPLIVRKLAEATGYTDPQHGKAALGRILQMLKYQEELAAETVRAIDETIQRLTESRSTTTQGDKPKLGCLLAVLMCPVMLLKYITGKRIN